jgi:pyruvate/2-oxoacid:ferredoxin oxidoreductase alpha subunit
MSQRDTGWVQLYCASAQEVLDAILCAYRVAERAMLPVLVCLEGFLLSHTSEAVDVPAQAAVDAFLPPLAVPAEWLLDPTRPRVFSELPEPDDYAAFQRHVDDAMAEAAKALEDVAEEFAERFGRTRVGALALAGDPGADLALVTIGTIGDTALELLEDGGEPVRLVRVHAFRPFPAEALRSALDGARAVAVIDRAPAFGSMGPLGGEVRALGLDAAVTTFVAGLGGTEVTPATLRRALERAQATPRDVAALGPIAIEDGGAT